LNHVEPPPIDQYRNKIICGDCLEILPKIPDGSIELVVTDIPYNEVNRETGGLRNIDKGSADDAFVSIPLLVEQIVRLANSAYVWCGIEQVSDLRREFVRNRMTTRQGVWIKSNPSPMNANRLWLSGVELCVFARRAKATFNRFCESPVWYGPSERVVNFPCPKPIWLIKELIDASSSFGDVVLDPFLGSGTTAVACKMLGRDFIGIEINPDYCRIAEKRLAALPNTKLEAFAS